MKTFYHYLILASALLCCTSAYSQCNFEREEAVYKSAFTQSVPYSASDVLLLSTNYSCPYWTIDRADCNGRVIWNTHLPVSYGIVNQVKVNPADSTIVAVGCDWQADDVPLPNLAKLFVLNSAGSIAQTVVFMVDSLIGLGASTRSKGFTDVAIDAHGVYYLLLEANLVKTDSSGSLLGNVPTGAMVNSILFDEVQNRLVCFTNNGIRFYDTNLQLISTEFSSSGYVKEVSIGSYHFVSTTTNFIEKFDETWSKVDSVLANDTLTGIETDGSSIYTYVKPANHYRHFAVYDTALALTDTFSIGRTDFYPMHFSVKNGDVNAVGLLNQYLQDYKYQQKFPAGSMSAFYPTEDIGVVDIHFDNVQQSFSHVSGFDSLYRITANCSATIKNFSADTIRHFYVNSPQLGGINCADRVYNLYVTQSILPFDTLNVSIASIDELKRANSSLELTLFTVAPNGHPDPNATNDSYLVQYIISSLSELALNSGISVFPNPSSHAFILRLPQVMAGCTMQVCTATGVLMAEQNIHGTQAEINVSNWSKGLYILTVVKDGKSERTKLMVE